MLSDAEVFDANRVLVKCVRILSAGRKMIREAGLDSPVMTNTERDARASANVLQKEIKGRTDIEEARLPGCDDEPGPPVGPEKTSG